MVIVATDHGRDPNPQLKGGEPVGFSNIGRNHGGQSVTERETFVASNVQLVHGDKSAPQVSVAATIADFLGLSTQGMAKDAKSVMDHSSTDTLKPYLLAAKIGGAMTDEAVGVALDAELKLVMSEKVQKGHGNITIRKSDGSVVEAIDVTSDKVSIDFGVVTVKHDVFSYGVDYYVTVDQGALRDVPANTAQTPNDMDAISSQKTIQFKTLPDTIAPHLVSSTYLDRGVVALDTGHLRLTFDEAVYAGPHNIIINNADNSVFEVIRADSPAVTISEKTVTIALTRELAMGSQFSVEIESGAFVDRAPDRAYAVIYSENFDELTESLQSYSSTNLPKDSDPHDWTSTAPNGWSVQNTGTVSYALIPEFKGWTFQNVQSWASIDWSPTADKNITPGTWTYIYDHAVHANQGFLNARGVIAVADYEYYQTYYALFNSDKSAKLGDPKSVLATLLRTSDIDLSQVKSKSVILEFDSAWHTSDRSGPPAAGKPDTREAPQEAYIRAHYKNGTTVDLLHWTNDNQDKLIIAPQGGSSYHNGHENEHVTVNFDIPDISSAYLTFELSLAAGYYWAIDNISVKADMSGLSNKNAELSGGNAVAFAADVGHIGGHVAISGAGLDGVKVDLFDAKGQQVATTYSVNGAYSFDGLKAGVYTESVVAPKGYNAQSRQITLASGQRVTDGDFNLHRPAGTQDFNADAHSDFLFQNGIDGACYVWEVDGFKPVAGDFVGKAVGAAWQVKDSGDFNGDGKSDILFQNVRDGAVYVWEMDGLKLLAGDLVGTAVGTAWQVKGTGDFNGDGKSDILFQNSIDGACYVWEMDGLKSVAGDFVGRAVGADWHVTS